MLGGDLRITHFIGIHALQLIPLLVLLLELASHRLPALRAASTRVALVWIGLALYVGLLGLVTPQALSGESIVHPDAGIAAATVALFVAAAVAVG